ncbi:hypothetical protein F4604DRAFT_1681767 [Suillus subluteus]|nr:hypothetical protein F4604DRAFT_1681767 [Suillus subluteus]
MQSETPEPLASRNVPRGEEKRKELEVKFDYHASRNTAYEKREELARMNFTLVTSITAFTELDVTGSTQRNEIQSSVFSYLEPAHGGDLSSSLAEVVLSSGRRSSGATVMIVLGCRFQSPIVLDNRALSLLPRLLSVLNY